MSMDSNKPFASEEEYLNELIALQGYRLLAYVKSIGEVDSIAALLEEKLSVLPEEHMDSVKEYDEYIQNRLKATHRTPIRYKLDMYCQKLQLSDFGVMLLIMSAMSRMDSDWASVFMRLTGNRCAEPTLELCAKIFFWGQDWTQVLPLLDSSKQEIYALFPALMFSRQPLLEPLAPDEFLLRHVVMQPGNSLRAFHFENMMSGLPEMLFRDNEKGCIVREIRSSNPPLFYLYGPKGAGKLFLCRHCAKELSRPLYVLDLDELGVSDDMDENSLKITLSIAARECLVTNALLVIRGLERLSVERRHSLMDFADEYLHHLTKGIFFLANETKAEIKSSAVLAFELGIFDEFQRGIIWKNIISAHEETFDFNVMTFANTFSCTPGQMETALENAGLLAKASDGKITKQLFNRAFYAQLEHELDKKASRVERFFSWEQLKLPRREKNLLREIIRRVEYKHIVYHQWEYDALLPYGRGISAVFSGPPGTGKTMAAHVLASELGMEMYRIDLSQIMDKYIGETEKNIRSIFIQAKQSNSILFFDEADALFSKRMESTGSNERFANIETALLLQCIEEYPGISILATNNLSNMDSAFLRRFTYIIPFSPPDAGMRLEIWKSVFPPKAPLSPEVELEYFASDFELTGANIKNIAVSAAFMAAAQNSFIETRHILRALALEYGKEGRKLQKNDCGHFSAYFSEIDLDV